MLTTTLMHQTKALTHRIAVVTRNKERLDDVIEECQEKLTAIEKVMALYGAAWKKPTKAVMVKKKAARKVAAKPRKFSQSCLVFALKHDLRGNVPLSALIAAYEEIVRDNPNSPVTISRLIAAFNARRVKKVRHTAVYSKLKNARMSRHPELASIFTPSGQTGGNHNTHYITLNPEAAATFKKLVKKMA